MKIIIEHLPDRKRPCIVLCDSNVGIVLGTLTNEVCEKILRKACGRNENQTLGIALSDCKYTIEELLKDED